MTKENVVRKKPEKETDDELEQLLAETEQEGDGEDTASAHLERLSNAFAASAKRWEMIVYPSLFAFIILAAYGFFLIYSLTKDAHTMAQNMADISVSMQEVTKNMETVSKNMVVMTQLVDNQSASMREMAISMRGMNTSMGMMRYDIAIMNQSVSRPMSFMNSFMPW